MLLLCGLGRPLSQCLAPALQLLLGLIGPQAPAHAGCSASECITLRLRPGCLTLSATRFWGLGVACLLGTEDSFSQGRYPICEPAFMGRKHTVGAHGFVQLLLRSLASRRLATSQGGTVSDAGHVSMQHSQALAMMQAGRRWTGGGMDAVVMLLRWRLLEGERCRPCQCCGTWTPCQCTSGRPPPCSSPSPPLRCLC